VDDDLSPSRYVDIFSLRVLSLIVCRGKPTEKAKFLADLINHGIKERIQWDNPRLRKAMRCLLYFSSILPLKFLTQNQDEEVFDRILSSGKFANTRKSMRNSILVHDIDKKNLWTEEHITQTDKLFDDVFELFMEEKFYDSVYPPNKSSLSQDEFAKRFQSNKHFSGTQGDGFSKKTGEKTKTVFWVFSPSKMSSAFN
jgi:hypothetical protein